MRFASMLVLLPVQVWGKAADLAAPAFRCTGFCPEWRPPMPHGLQLPQLGERGDATPPEAVMARPPDLGGQLAGRAARLVPCIRAVAGNVGIDDGAQPASARRRQKSTPVQRETSSQPLTATKPSRASTPTAMCRAVARAMRAVKAKSRTAAVPRMHRPTPSVQIGCGCAPRRGCRRRPRGQPALLCQRGDRREVGGRALPGAVQIDDVEVLRPRARQKRWPGHGAGVAA
jgi:hypothetical protein